MNKIIMNKIISLLIISIGVLSAGLLPEKRFTDAESDNSDKQTTSGTSGLVELRIFSGRENPTWSLSEEDTKTLFNLLAKLPGVPAKRFNDGLGYTGFRVRKIGTLSKLPHDFEIYKGVAFDGTHYYKDRNRRLENWILRSGKEHLDAKLYATVEKEIRSSHE